MAGPNEAAIVAQAFFKIKPSTLASIANLNALHSHADIVFLTCLVNMATPNKNSKRKTCN